ncbi:MAG: hypothetical protein ACFE9I_18390 [Candidatus Hermodarchaeota archaeon]
MGKGSTALGVIGLILAAGGLGFGGLAWLSVSRVINEVESFSEQEIWYKFNDTIFNSDPVYSYLTCSGLTVEFELGPNESVYFSFTARAHIEVKTGWSRITTYFKVDGVLETDPSAEVGMYNGAFTVNFMLALQHVRHDLSPGLHNVTVVLYGDYSGNYIYKSSLFVQTFPT